MKNRIIYILFLFLMFSYCFPQVKPYLKPNSFNNTQFSNYVYIEEKNNTFNFEINNQNDRIILDLGKKGYYRIEIITNQLKKEDKIFIIDYNNNEFIGPYTLNDVYDNKIRTDIIHTNKIIFELNTNIIEEHIHINLKYEEEKTNLSSNINTVYKSNNSLREEPVIIVTGFWPPTNEMIRHFSQNTDLNPNGWEGDNWENRGYDIISYFPTFDDPDCSNCGQGYGDFEVDYQDTSSDFWPIFNSLRPIGVITFSRGYINLSWEVENNYYNRTNWYGDYSPPTLPTPNPPDEEEVAFFMRNSNLPMNDIVDNISNLNLGLDPYIDINGDPGQFVSEFMGYHGVWYRDLNSSGEDLCLSAGHVHVGGNIDIDTAKLATEETIRTLINHLDQFIYTPGDVNQDELIDILDLVLIMNNILGVNDFSQIQFLSADMNEDGIINIQDMIIIINFILNNF